ncbi:hypothetical protein X777_05156 [Ooceraea biroi]|uniref:Uncharacterized protein n=1 Tax=Ooceraea biroi TaxID=2015173 RepID=A0A026WJL7_OOCBI|nr:hypothetical protein X777_05156 [Ooceraea biroi]
MKWKATELRQFLLYTGLFVLNGIISKNHLEHFKIFHTAIFILSHPNLAVTLCNYAQALLIEFVKTFDEFYGLYSKIYNVHNLVHLPDDVRNFNRPLDDISAFDFENLLGKIKRSLRSGRKPLSQLSRRFSESASTSAKYVINWELKRKHKCEPLVTGLENSISQYKEIIINKFHFVTCHKCDCCALMRKYAIVDFIKENSVEIILSSWISSCADLGRPAEHRLGGAACVKRSGRAKKRGQAAAKETGTLTAPATPARPPPPIQGVEGAGASEQEAQLEAPKEQRQPKRPCTDRGATAVG